MFIYEEVGIIYFMDEIDVIGYRVVYGGEYFSDVVVVNEEVKKVIRECIEFVFFYNFVNLMGIEVCEREILGKFNVVVFDIVFY